MLRFLPLFTVISVWSTSALATVCSDSVGESLITVSAPLNLFGAGSELRAKEELYKRCEDGILLYTNCFGNGSGTTCTGVCKKGKVHDLANETFLIAFEKLTGIFSDNSPELARKNIQNLCAQTHAGGKLSYLNCYGNGRGTTCTGVCKGVASPTGKVVLLRNPLQEFLTVKAPLSARPNSDEVALASLVNSCRDGVLLYQNCFGNGSGTTCSGLCVRSKAVDVSRQKMVFTSVPLSGHDLDGRATESVMAKCKQAFASGQGIAAHVNCYGNGSGKSCTAICIDASAL